MAKWRAVKIPEELAKIIEEIVKEGKYGYTSISDFVTDSVRKRLRELGVIP